MWGLEPARYAHINHLAKRLRVPINSMRQKLNVNNSTHNFHPAQLMLLMRELDDVTILKHMAEFLGYVVHPDRRIFDGDLLDALTEVQVAVSGLLLQAATLHQDKVKGRVEYPTANDVNRVHYHAQEVQHAVRREQLLVWPGSILTSAIGVMQESRFGRPRGERHMKSLHR